MCVLFNSQSGCAVVAKLSVYLKKKICTTVLASIDFAEQFKATYLLGTSYRLVGLTEYPAVAVLQVIVSEIIVIEIMRLVGQGGRTWLCFQQEVGGRSSLHGALKGTLKGTLLPHDLTVIHTEITYDTGRFSINMYEESRYEAGQEKGQK